jgi:hypothetical protein
LEHGEGVEDSDGEDAFGYKSICDVNDCNIGERYDVLADMGFGVEVTKSPSWMRSAICRNPWVIQSLTSTVEINMYWPRAWTCWLVHPY